MKHSLSYLPHCLLPLLLLASLNYWNGLRTVDATLGSQAQAHLNSLAGDIDRRLRNEEIEITRLALSSQVKGLLTKPEGAPAVLTSENLPSDVALVFSSVLEGRGHCFRLGVFDRQTRAVFRIAKQKDAHGADVLLINGPDFAPPVEAGLALKGTSASHEINGTVLRYSVPISVDANRQGIGIIVADVNLADVVEESSRVLIPPQTVSSAQQALVMVIDPSAKIIYHPNKDLEGKATSSVQPEFLSIAEPLVQGVSGIKHFMSADNHDFLTAFSPLPQWELGIAVGYDRVALRSSAHWWGIAGFLLALVGGVAGALLVSRQVHRRSSGLERVEQDLTAIAKGEFDRRIELKSSDDARTIADNINVMTERLRTQIAREEETRQFQSFVKLSAMLTHDLKNAIEALSLIVGNMERHFDNEEFRRDALISLTSATEKLKGIVARLTRPLSSLSGEHPRPKSVDLVPIIRRVTAMTAEPLSEKHALDIRLPKNLLVFTDPERIEKVIENLIINALEAMADKNGKLTIEAGLTSRGAATFSITDTGNGMSQKFIDNQLFRPFATTKKHGVGLGLYTCREVIEASAGTISVDSKEGAGTTFRVVLPSASHDSHN